MKEAIYEYRELLYVAIGCAVILFFFFLPVIIDLFKWIGQQAKESQQIGELSRKITESDKYVDSGIDEEIQEVQNQLNNHKS